MGARLTCEPYCPGWRHERGCAGEQAWDIPEACHCSRPECRDCRLLNAIERVLALPEEARS